ncbi:hypothetical protein M422DRAFT_196762 [Sphaerobolus stellatus SS14]|uniref:Uncharacterized protein n=1 Tax=Sphaerobolus stellatus (strain SS14) TaxID=990650 RepID=A0A0C9U157_SPHS4|nr:hypothetical protein M422DRAFT_196762 [Sphaerobolus stellatus SS14]
MYSRSATLFLALAGTLLNAAAAVHLFALWQALRTFDTDSEYEGSEEYTLDALRFIWCLLSLYYTVAAAACVVGILGVVRRIPSYVRLFRDYSFADLGLCTFSTIAFSFASFRPEIRSAICEELSRHPDLLRDLAESGLNIENCEGYFENAVVALVGLMGILLVVRLQFTLTISHYYTHLFRNALHLSIVRSSSRSSPHPHRIYLLPNTSTPLSDFSSTHPTMSHTEQPDIIVYAPVSINSDDARQLDATEAWVSLPPRSSHAPHHSRRGRINLPVRPNEGLLPHYQDLPKEV